MNRPAYIDAIPDSARRLHVAQYVVRWSDMDNFGHVNNAKYFTYFEQVRIDWLRQMGEEHSIVLATVGCTFLRPARFPASLQVTLYADNPGTRSLDSYYAIRDVDDPSVLYTLGHGTVVWFDHASGKSIPIPSRIRRLLTG